jgi:hypothetical protein
MGTWGAAAPSRGLRGSRRTRRGETDPQELARLKLTAGDRPAVVVEDAAAGEIERLMNRAHAAGITGVSCSFGTLVRTADGALAFGDLTKARKHHPSSVYFVASRDADRRAFNQAFGESLPTDSTTRQPLRELEARKPERPRHSGPPVRRQVAGCGIANARGLGTSSARR